MGENIGAAARGMLNFGLSDLRIVAPRDGWPNQAAIDMSSGALDKITPRIFNSLQEAVADLHFVIATTARPRDMVKPVFTPAGAIAETNTRHDQKTGFVFGPERAGLTNDDVALCHAILTIPVNPDFWSLNLSSSVLLVAYEWLKSRDQTPELMTPTGNSEAVTHDALEAFLNRLESELQSGGFFKSPDLKPTMVRNIRSMFTRGNLTDQEVRTFHGMITALIANKSKVD